MGNKNIKKEEKKKKKTETKATVSSSIKSIVSQPELIKKPKKGI